MTMFLINFRAYCGTIKRMFKCVTVLYKSMMLTTLRYSYANWTMAACEVIKTESVDMKITYSLLNHK